MQGEKMTLHQGNMYCSMCILNVATALSRLENVAEFGVDINTKTITIKFRDDVLEQKELQSLINQALTTGIIPFVTEEEVE